MSCLHLVLYVVSLLKYKADLCRRKCGKQTLCGLKSMLSADSRRYIAHNEHLYAQIPEVHGHQPIVQYSLPDFGAEGIIFRSSYAMTHNKFLRQRYGIDMQYDAIRTSAK